MMATKSFIKSVNISGRKNVRQFLHAIDRVEHYKCNRCEDKPSSYSVAGDNLDTLLSGYALREGNR